MIRKLMASGVMAVVATAGGLIATPAPAVAAGTYTGCTIWKVGGAPQAEASGWCNGTGPDYTYRAVVGCTNGTVYVSPARWMGDRRGQTAYCPYNVRAEWGGMYVYYKGVYKTRKIWDLRYPS